MANGYGSHWHGLQGLGWANGYGTVCHGLDWWGYVGPGLQGTWLHSFGDATILHNTLKRITMKQTFFHTNRFTSGEAATKAGELYLVEYAFPVMQITDPAGVVTTLPMAQRPKRGLKKLKLSGEDQHALNQFLSAAMGERHKAWLAGLRKQTAAAKMLVAAAQEGTLDDLLSGCDRTTDPAGYIVQGVLVADEQIADVRETWKVKEAND